MTPSLAHMQTGADRSRPECRPTEILSSHRVGGFTSVRRPYTPYYIYKGYIFIYTMGIPRSEKYGLRSARSAQTYTTPYIPRAYV